MYILLHSSQVNCLLYEAFCLVGIEPHCLLGTHQNLFFFVCLFVIALLKLVRVCTVKRSSGNRPEILAEFIGEFKFSVSVLLFPGFLLHLPVIVIALNLTYQSENLKFFLGVLEDCMAQKLLLPNRSCKMGAHTYLRIKSPTVFPIPNYLFPSALAYTFSPLFFIFCKWFTLVIWRRDHQVCLSICLK